MASFFISSTTESDWAFDPDALARAIQQRYSDADVRGPQTPADAYQLHWTVATGSDVPLEGALDREGDGLTLDGDVGDCAQFAVWVQAVAPAGAELSFYDEGYTSAIVLEPTTREEDLVAAFV